MKNRTTAQWGLVLALAICTSAYAHHGTGIYDFTKPLTLKGMVTEFDWVNPHTQIYFDVTDARGHVEHWECETLGPVRLSRAGWKKNSIKAGDAVTITLSPSRNGSPVGYLMKLVLPDGTVLTSQDELSGGSAQQR